MKGKVDERIAYFRIDEDTAVDHLDFEFVPKCELALVLCIFGREFKVKQCRRPAKWLTVCPDCGHEAYACEQHRYTELEQMCKTCRKWQPPGYFRWYPIK